MTLKWAGAAGLQSTTAAMEWQSLTATTIETTIARSNGTAWRQASGSTKSVQHVAYYAAAGVHYYRVYFYLVASCTGDGIAIVSVDNGANRKIDVRLRNAANSNKLQLFNNEDAAQIGTDSGALSTATWYRLELKVDDTTLSATTAEARLYAASDEATLVWNPSGTANLAAAPNRFGVFNRNDASLDLVFTDVVIILGDATAPNDWAGEGSIVYLRPDGDSGVPTWTRGGADSGANWSQTDETPPNDATDYVESLLAGQVDDYTLSACPAAVGATDVINWVAPGVRFAISATTGGDPDCVIRATINSNLSESGNISGVGATAYVSYQTTPVCVLPLVITTASLTKAMLDAATGGMRETATDTHLIRVSAYWLMFDHKPAAGGGAISGTAAMVFGQSGPLTGAGAVAGTSAIVSGQTGAVTASGALAGAGAMLFAQTGAVTGAGALAGTSPILFGQTGALAGSGALLGTSGLLFGQTGVAAGTGVLAGSTAVIFGQTGALDGGAPPSGDMTGLAAMLFGQVGALAGAGALTGLSVILFGQTGTMSGGAVPGPGTRDVRRAKGRGLYLSDAPQRQTASARTDLKAEG